MKNFIQSQRAFTLVELLVVISIIALLISMLLPAMGRARESAQRIQCASQMRSSGQAMVMYAMDNKEVIAKTDYGRLDTDTSWTGFMNSIGNSRGTPDEKKIIYHGSWLMNGYLNNASIFWCPGERILKDETVITFAEQRVLYIKNYRNTFASGGIEPYTGKNWRPLTSQSYTFNGVLVPTDPMVSPQSTSNMMVNKQNPRAGRKFYEFNSSFPVLVDHRGSTVDSGLTVNHRSQGYNMLRGDGAVKFLSPAAIVSGASAPGINLSTTTAIRANPGSLPEDPREDDPAWGQYFANRMHAINNSTPFWNSAHGALTQ